MVKTRWQSLLLDTGFAAKDNRLFINGTLTGRDTVRMAKLWNELRSSGPQWPDLSVGLRLLWLGRNPGRDASITRPSAQAGGPTIGFKGTLAVGRIQSLGHDALILKGTHQNHERAPGGRHRADVLLGGPDSVRESSTRGTIRRRGYAVTAETRIPLLPSMLPDAGRAVF